MNFVIKPIGKYRALYGGRKFVKVLGRLLGQLENPRTGKKEKMDPNLNALLLLYGYIFVARDDETCAEALERYLNERYSKEAS